MKYLHLDKPVYDPETEVLVPDYKIENGTFISGWKVEKKPCHLIFLLLLDLALHS